MQVRAFPASYPEMALVSSADAFVDGIKTTYNRYRQMGFFRTTDRPVLLHHRIDTEAGTFNGLVAAIDVEDYLSRRIVPHEKTIAELEQKQVNLLMDTGAQLKPVMLTYREVPAISNLLERLARERPTLLQFTFEGFNETHTFQPIEEGSGLRALASLFEREVERVYIADGHHRMAANARLYQQGQHAHAASFRWVPAALYAHTSVRIFEYNRVVTGLEGLRPAWLMAALSKYFEVEPLPGPARPVRAGMLTMYLDQCWFSLRWREPLAPGELDVARLDEAIFAGVLGITDIRTDSRVIYVEGIQPLERVMAKAGKPGSVAFCLHPLDVNTFMSLCDTGRVLPPKSTWFEPRIRSGLIVRQVL